MNCEHWLTDELRTLVKYSMKQLNMGICSSKKVVSKKFARLRDFFLVSHQFCHLRLRRNKARQQALGGFGP